MKTVLSMIAAMFILAACQQPKSKALQDAEELYEMSKQNTQYVGLYGDDARAKMILKYGDKKMAWFDSASAATAAEFDRSDSIDQAKVDSVNELINK